VSTWHETDSFWHEMQGVMFAESRIAQAETEIPAVLVVGVDRTARYLDLARERAPGVEFIQGDMRELVRPAAFDLALNLFTSFGYFEDPDDDRRQLESYFHALRPEGLLVMELTSKEVLAMRLQPTRCWELADGTLLVERVKIRAGWTHSITTWTLVGKDGTRRDRTFTVRQYSGAVLKGLLLRTGFRAVELYGALDGRPYDHDAVRLVVVARR
jgi:SAM-dependent methyltransferase